MAKKVQYIKIARIDQNGNDLTNTLESLTQITIPLTISGNKTYKILTRADFPTYYLFQVNLDNSPDAATQPNTTSTTLDYAFTGSLTGSVSSVGTTGKFAAQVPIVSGEGVNPDFYNSEQQRVEINTLPRENIYVKAIFTASIESRNGGIELYQADSTFSNVTQLTSTATLTIGRRNGVREASIPKANITPGDIFFLGVTNQADSSPYVTASFDDTTLIITSSAASGPTLENIVEPYLAKKFINSDCDVLINNADQYEENPFLQDIDFSSGTIVPVNYNQIVTGTAQKATVPESMFTMGGMINPNNSAVNQIERFNISGSSYFGQTSGATNVVYYSSFATGGGGNHSVSGFAVKYIITSDGEAIEITNDSDTIDYLQRLFGSTANPKDLKTTASSYGNNVSIKTRAIPISGSTATNNDLAFNGYSKVERDGDQVVVFVRNSGSFTSGNFGPGILFPESIRLTSHADLPGKARQILTEKNVIPPAD